jgi:hypothetical protein
LSIESRFSRRREAAGAAFVKPRPAQRRNAECLLFRVLLDRDSTDVAFPIQVEQRVLVEIPGLGNFRLFELDVERIGILEVADFHG